MNIFRVGIVRVAIFWVGVFLVPPLVAVSVLLMEMKKNPFFAEFY